MPNTLPNLSSAILVQNEAIRVRIGQIRCARYQLGKRLNTNGERHVRLMHRLGCQWVFGDAKAAAEGEITHLKELSNARAAMHPHWPAWREKTAV